MGVPLTSQFQCIQKQFETLSKIIHWPTLRKSLILITDPRRKVVWFNIKACKKNHQKTSLPKNYFLKENPLHKIFKENIYTNAIIALVHNFI